MLAFPFSRMVLKRSLCSALIRAFFLSLLLLVGPSKSAAAARTPIAPDTIRNYLYLGGALRLACDTTKGKLGRLSQPRLAAGVRFQSVVARKLSRSLSRNMSRIKDTLKRGRVSPDATRRLKKKFKAVRLKRTQLRTAAEECKRYPMECDDRIDNDGDGLVDWQYDLGCTGPRDKERSGAREAKGGWSTYDPSPDTRIIYVSSSLGQDNWSGILPEPSSDGTDGPLKSVIAGYSKLRDGYPDWLLFRRGDEWTDEPLVRDNKVAPYTGRPNISGRSETERLIIGSYGLSLSRPKFNFSNQTWFQPSGNSDQPKHLSIIGLHLYAYSKDPLHPKFNAQSGSAIQWLSKGGDFLLEDCKIEYAQVNLQGEPTDPLTLRRNILSGNYSVGSHAQSIFTSIRAPLTLEENLFNHGGWNEDFKLVLLKPSSDLMQWRSVSDGRLRVELKEMNFNVHGIDFSSVSTMPEVASVLEKSINAAVGVSQAVEVSWTEGKVFKIQSGLESDDGYGVSRWRLREVGIYRVGWGQNAAMSETAGTETSITAEKTLVGATLTLRPDDTAAALWDSFTDAEFTITVNGTVYPITGLNLAGTDGMPGVASRIQDATNAAIQTATSVPGVITVTWDGTKYVFSSSVSQNGRQDITDLADIVQYPAPGLGSDLTAAAWLNALADFGQGVPESTVFNRNEYLSHGYGNTTVRGNIDANGASGGVQQRMGGINENNLFLRNPHAVIFGSSENDPQNVTGVIRNNVVLGARDIDTQVQGSGILLTSSAATTQGPPSLIEGVEVYGNIIAHNEFGTGNFKAIALFGTGEYINTDVHDNIVYDWSRPAWPNPTDHRSDCFFLALNASSVNCKFRDNYFQQPVSGFLGSSSNDAAGISLFNNTYFSAEPDPPSVWSRGWFELGGSVSWATWMSRTHEIGAINRKVQFVDPNRTIETYMGSLGQPASYEAFIERAKEQSKYNWDSRFTARAVNAYVREGFGIAG